MFTTLSLKARILTRRHRRDARRAGEPLQVAASHVDRIAAGEIPPPIEGDHADDFARLRDNLNACIQAVNALVQDTHGLVQAAVDGKLSVRAEFDHSLLPLAPLLSAAPRARRRT